MIVSLLLLLGCPQDVSVLKARVDNDGDGYTAEADCDDMRASVHPDADELCDGADNDCDGTVDEEGAVDGTTYYVDADGDGHGVDGPTLVACDLPDGRAAVADDCDDAAAERFPGNDEVCDGLDNDCDEAVDEDAVDASTWYVDADEDGYGDGNVAITSCDPPVGYVLDGTDCDDDAYPIHPDAPETDCADPTDYNCDGSVGYADADGDGVAACEDCDDTTAERSPYNAERCDDADVDEDCDGASDDADDSAESTTMTAWYRDYDGDRWVSGTGVAVVQCDTPSEAYASALGDCDDLDDAVNPGADEVCDPDDVDEDCDGAADDADGSTEPSSFLTFYADVDEDAHGDPSRSIIQCDPIAGFVADATDCDDRDADRNPAEVEVCDAADKDEDCDSLSDDADPSVSDATRWFVDADDDGYGDDATVVTACDQPADTVSVGADCDDAEASINPGADEVCDAAGTDEDCDGLADDDDPSTLEASRASWYLDDDGDGFGDRAEELRACDNPSPSTRVADGSDCDDVSDSDNPAATEICDNGDDDDCSGVADDGCGVEYTLESSSSADSDATGIVYGEGTGAGLGAAMTVADLEDDGSPDVIVASQGYKTSGRGRVYAYDTMPTGVAEADAGASAVVAGSTVTSFDMGYGVYGLGDFDADGRDELAVVAQWGATRYVYVFQGESLVGSVSYGVWYDYETWTGPAAPAGDFDATTGNDEIAIAYTSSSSSAGAVLVYGYASSGLTLRTTISGEDASDYAGYGLAGGAGNDADGDGYDDLFVGAYGDDTAASNAGAAYIVTGPATSAYDLSAATKITGGAATDYFGVGVFAPGDVDGDGAVDLVVGASGADDGGSAAGALYVFTSVNPDSASVDTSVADAVATIVGDNANDGVGTSVAIGDVDDDGEVDLLIGASGWDAATSAASAGAAWVVRGPLSGTYDLSLNTDYAARYLGDDASDACGAAVALADMDNDGDDDVAIGCSAGDADTVTGRGTVYFFESP